MAGERHPQGDQPPADIGHERAPSGRFDRSDDHHPVHRGRRAANRDEPERVTGTGGGPVAHSASRPADFGAGAIVCLCADDYGLNEGINSAVQRLVAMERVHATGALVGAPAWQAGIGFLRRMHAEGLDVGLHLDFTEHPLIRSRSDLRPLIVQSYAGHLDRPAIRAEIRAQLDAFEQGVGHAPAFVDGHQHVHQLPAIREELLEELDDRYGAYPPWIRRTRQRPGARASAGLKAWIKATTIAALGASSLTAAARRHGLPQNRALLGVYDFSGGAHRYLTLLRGWLSAAREGDLLMCHPRWAIGRGDPLAAAREAEYQVLASRHFGQLVEELGVVLWPMSHILADVD